MPSETLLGQDSQLGYSFLQTPPSVSAPFADCSLHPCTLINPCSKYDYILRPEDPPSESPYLAVVFETLTEILYFIS